MRLYFSATSGLATIHPRTSDGTTKALSIVRPTKVSQAPMTIRVVPPIAQVSVTSADRGDREKIYAARHEVYARELRQHNPNDEGLLRDSLDERNDYVVAKDADELLGFISITPPGGRYSIDKYFQREELPFVFDEGLYEIRLLTVLSAHRGRVIGPLLMYAALRYVESQKGSRLVAIGRREVLGLYTRCGMNPLGVNTTAGAVQYELLIGSTGQVRSMIAAHAQILIKMKSIVDWQLPFKFYPEAHCTHGGAFWEVLGNDFADLSRARNVVNADVLDAWFDPAPEVVSALQANLPLLLRTSPPTRAEGLIRAISRARKVPEECVITAAGSSALIFLALRSWLNPGSRVLLLDPMYCEYGHVANSIVGCTVDSIVASREDRFVMDLGHVAERLANGYDLVILVNPNSPTGTLLPPDRVKKLFSQFERTRFLIDETYLEFAGVENSVEQFAAESKNAFVCKSMSKVYALSGARVAYMIGPEAEIVTLGTLLPPWAVSLPAQVAAVAALSAGKYYATQYQRTALLRDELTADLLERCGIVAYESVTNCLLCELPANAPDAAEIVLQARDQNVFLRTGQGIHRSLGPRTIRIAVKNREMNQEMIRVLERLVQRSGTERSPFILC
jgi:histidinol-phosphate/aromatic aminotransferase/cobyric acid decarboxylase-like protein/GNAT superfamily N-acetyltransferase